MAGRTRNGGPGRDRKEGVSDNVIVLREMDRAMRRRGPNADIPALAEASGLGEKVIRVAFPGGQQSLIDAVIGSTCDEFDEVVTNPMLTAPTPKDAMVEAATGLAAYYEGGARSCLFELFSVPDDTPHAPVIKDTARRFLDGLEVVFERAGRSPEDAKARAYRVFAELQGTLILGRMTGDNALFRAFTDQLRRWV